MSSRSSLTVPLALVVGALGAGLVYAGLTGQDFMGELRAAFSGAPSIRGKVGAGIPRRPRSLTAGGGGLPSRPVSSTAGVTGGAVVPLVASSSSSSIPADNCGGSAAVTAAMSQLGVPYRFGAASPGVAFDCSGLTKWAWAQAGVAGLPHYAAAQYAMLPKVSWPEARPGDLVFFTFFADDPLGHCGIYVGNGQMVHAPRTGDVVKVAPVNTSKLVGVGRPCRKAAP